MSATVEEVASLANLRQFFADTEHNTTHGACHNACAWLMLEIKKAGLSDYNIHFCVGSFADYDHSWLMIEHDAGDSPEYTVIDMTVDQFVPEIDHVPYVGPAGPAYVIHSSAVLCDMEEVHHLLCAAGV